MMREAAISWCSCFLVVILVLHCITSTNCQSSDHAQTNSKTTLLDRCGASSDVITTLPMGEQLRIICKKEDAFVFDDPWWLNVTVITNNFGTLRGWVADYFADCGHIGFCNAPLCA